MQFWIVPFVLGAIYNIIKLRNVFYLKHINAINNNIRIRLLDSFSDHTELSTYVNQLGWKQLKPVFYKFVDSKPDMKVKADNVRMNGLILSSLADAAILSLIGVPLYVGFYCWKDSLYYLIPLGICLVVFLASYLLLPLARNKHIEYSDEQIDSIISNYKGELEESLMNLTK